MLDFIKSRAKACTYVLKGLVELSKEPSIITQLIIFGLLFLAGFYFQISRMDWIWQILVMGMVLGTESLNTAIERMADYIQPNFDKKIGVIKDIAAGAVGIVAFVGFIILIMIYAPYIMDNPIMGNP